ncbi:MAG: hypothetical protein Ct9H300mP4_16040 [Gammaproteobacteria bacterium]|nr:MAG: hypothetical protein Ct9H300mP4_16040 [Gammaproteobacteria bacterium]
MNYNVNKKFESLLSDSVMGPGKGGMKSLQAMLTGTSMTMKSGYLSIYGVCLRTTEQH